MGNPPLFVTIARSAREQGTADQGTAVRLGARFPCNHERAPREGTVDGEGVLGFRNNNYVFA